MRLFRRKKCSAQITFFCGRKLVYPLRGRGRGTKEGGGGRLSYYSAAGLRKFPVESITSGSREGRRGGKNNVLAYTPDTYV